MIGIFRANNPLNTSLLFIYGLILKLNWFLFPQIPEVHSSDGFLYKSILKAVKPYLDPYPLSYSIIAWLLLFTQALALNHVVNSRKLMQKPNYLPAMSYLLISSFFAAWNVLSAPLIVSSFLLWIYTKLTFFYKSPKVKSTLYSIGLVTGLCSFFYFPSLVFAVLVIFSLVATRPFRIAEWLLPILGITTCWYFLFSYMFLTDKLYTFSLQSLQVSIPRFSYERIEYAGILLIILLITTGAFYVQANLSKQVVQVRKNWTLMFLYLFVTLLLPFINTNYYLDYWILAIAPASAYTASAFYYPRMKWITGLTGWIMLVFVIYVQYFGK